MNRTNKKVCPRRALTIMELVIAMAMITIIFAAVLPQFAILRNSWDSKQGTAEALQNGRVLMDHISHNFSKAVKITDVSESDDIDGYIEFKDNDGNTIRYDIAANKYVEYGEVGNLSDLAGPVSSLTFTCYDACDLDNELSPVDDVNIIRAVKVDAIFTNAASIGRDQAFTTWAYLRINWAYSSGCDPNLVGWWKLDETSGTTAEDSSGNSNDGTLTNMLGNEWTTGQISGALTFDGTNDVVDCGNDPILNLDIGSWGAWVKLDEPKKWAERIIFKDPSNTGAYQSFDWNGFKAEVVVGGVRYRASSPSSTNTGQWYHVFATYDGETLRLYIDGEEVDSETGPSGNIDNNTGPLGVGSSPSSPTFAPFYGTIDDARVYNRALDPDEVAQLASTIDYDTFNEAKVSAADSSITISTPGDSSVVATLGSWTSGLTHTAESGSNRALILIAHGEEAAAAISLNSVTYGGQSMTKVIERIVGTNPRDYVVAYILNEAGIAAATSDTFFPAWSTTPDEVSYSSVFLQNVNQTTLIGASASNGATSGATITTSALATSNGDMVIDAATCGNVGDYTVNNSFTEAIEQDMATSVGTTGYKSATGSNETPSVTHVGTMNRQVIIGFVVQGGGLSSIEGDLLIAAVATDGDTSSSLAPPGGEGWTEIDIDTYSSEVTLGAWWKLADASESASHQFTWTGDEQAYGWMMHFTGHHLTDPIDVWSSSGESSSTPTSPAVTTTMDNCMILRLGAFDGDDITEDAPGLSGHTAITMDESASGSSTVAILGSWTSGLTHIAESGSDRLLIFIAHGEYSSSMNLSSVTYGGQTMTKVIEITAGTFGFRNYVAAFILDEAGVTAAYNNNFNVNWSGGTPTSASYASVFLSNVDQTALVGASDSAGTTSSTNPIETAPLSTEDGDMVIVAAVSGDNGSYTLNNYFTEGTDQSVGSYGHTGVTGHKAATGVDETPSATFDSSTTRQAIIGFVVQGGGGGSSDTVSGGAGYVRQATAGSSGTSTFALTASNEAQMITIAIAPANNSAGCCGEQIRP